MCCICIYVNKLFLNLFVEKLWHLVLLLTTARWRPRRSRVLVFFHSKSSVCCWYNRQQSEFCWRSVYTDFSCALYFLNQRINQTLSTLSFFISSATVVNLRRAVLLCSSCYTLRLPSSFYSDPVKKHILLLVSVCCCRVCVCLLPAGHREPSTSYFKLERRSFIFCVSVCVCILSGSKPHLLCSSFLSAISCLFSFSQILFTHFHILFFYSVCVFFKTEIEFSIKWW